jgi:hypothetical protein
MSTAKEHSAAIVTIHDAARMSPTGRKAIAQWLRNHARWLERHGREYAPRFRGRYIYATKRRKKAA